MFMCSGIRQRRQLAYSVVCLCLDTRLTSLYNIVSLGFFFRTIGILFIIFWCALQDLKQIMESAKEGIVYFSLGSVVKSSKMPKETVSLLLSELSKIEQTVLWKWEADDIPQLPKNVIVRKWFPQNDILGMYLILIQLLVRPRKY